MSPSPAIWTPPSGPTCSLDEKARALELQQTGTWVHLWRVVGHYSNVSVFEVDSPDELHQILWNLPLFPFMTVAVTSLTEHPSALSANS